MLDLDAVHAAAQRYTLVLSDVLTRQDSGDLLGRGTGSSVEYQDHLSYFLGDDVRHIDWAAYARTDRLTLKMYRQEIAPMVDVVLDGSASCGADPAKRAHLVNVAAALYLMGARYHAHAQLWRTGGAVRRVDRLEDLNEMTFAPERDLVEALRHAPLLRRRSLKIVVSDFLFEHDPRDLAAMLGGQADRLVLVQVLSAFEHEPRQFGGLMLRDADTGERIDLTLDEELERQYRQRLGNLRESLAAQARRIGGTFAALHAGQTLEDAMAELTRREVVTAA